MRNIEAVISAKADFDRVFRQFEQSSKRAGRAGAEAFDRVDKSTDRAERSAGRATVAARRFSREMDGSRRSANRLTASVNNLGRSTLSLRSSFAGLGAGLVGGFTAANAVRTLVEFDKGLVGVGKTADISGRELDALGDRVVDLSRKLKGVSTARLLEIAQTAGQLGIRGSDIERFTETIARLEVSSNLRGQEGATQVARTIQISGGDIAKVEKYASAIVDLGNNLKANEAQIARVALEVAKATNAYDIATEDVIGLSGAIAATGTQAELARSSFLKTFRTIDDAVRGGGDALDRFAEIAGTSSSEFADAYRRNATDALVLFLGGLRRMKEEGVSVGQTLESVGLSGDRVVPVLQTLSKGVDEVAGALARSRKETANAQALNAESSKSFQTLGARLQAVKNAYDAVIISQRNNAAGLGDFLEASEGAIRILGGIGEAEDFASDGAIRLTAAVEGLTIALAGVAAIKIGGALIALSTGLGAIPLAVAGATAGLAAIERYANRATRAVEAQKRAQEEFRASLQRPTVSLNILQDADAGDVRARLRLREKEFEDTKAAIARINDLIREQKALGAEPTKIRVDVAEFATTFSDVGVFIDVQKLNAKIKDDVKSIETALNSEIRKLQVSESLTEKLLGSGLSDLQVESFVSKFEDAVNRRFAPGSRIVQDVVSPDVTSRTKLVRDLLKDVESALRGVSSEAARGLGEKAFERARDRVKDAKKAVDDFTKGVTQARAETKAAVDSITQFASVVGPLEAVASGVQKAAAGFIQLRENSARAIRISDSGLDKEIQTLEAALRLQEQYNLNATDAVSAAEREGLIRNALLDKSDTKLAAYIERLQRANDLRERLNDRDDDAPAAPDRPRRARRSFREFRRQQRDFAGQVGRVTGLNPQFIPENLLGRLQFQTGQSLTNAAAERTAGQFAGLAGFDASSAIEANEEFVASLQRINESIRDTTGISDLFVANLQAIGENLSDPARLTAQLSTDLVGGVRGSLQDAAREFRESGDLGEAGKVLGIRLSESAAEAFTTSLFDLAIGEALSSVLGDVGGDVAESASAAALSASAGALTGAAGAHTGAAGAHTGAAGALSAAAAALTAAGASITASSIAASTQSAAGGVGSVFQSVANVLFGKFAKGGVFTSSEGGAPRLAKFAKGGTFGASERVVKMASGSVLQRLSSNGIIPTTTRFKLADGRDAVAGEAGPEAVMPLDRGPDGSLGVRATGVIPEVVVQAPPLPNIRVDLPSMADPIPDELREFFRRATPSIADGTPAQIQSAFGRGDSLPGSSLPSRPSVSQAAAPINVTVQYNPRIEIKGNADRDTVDQALRADRERFRADLIEDMRVIANRETRATLASGDDDIARMIAINARNGS